MFQTRSRTRSAPVLMSEVNSSGSFTSGLGILVTRTLISPSYGFRTSWRRAVFPTGTLLKMAVALGVNGLSIISDGSRYSVRRFGWPSVRGDVTMTLIFAGLAFLGVIPGEMKINKSSQKRITITLVRGNPERGSDVRFSVFFPVCENGRLPRDFFQYFSRGTNCQNIVSHAHSHTLGTQARSLTHLFVCVCNSSSFLAVIEAGQICPSQL